MRRTWFRVSITTPMPWSCDILECDEVKKLNPFFSGIVTSRPQNPQFSYCFGYLDTHRSLGVMIPLPDREKIYYRGSFCLTPKPIKIQHPNVFWSKILGCNQILKVSFGREQRRRLFTLLSFHLFSFLVSYFLSRVKF